ncbi:MAG TPA: TetR/AcrR family transcriptional regulator [Gammaproteobacteria bacterium]
MGRVSDARERLMSAAAELTWEAGYNAVTVDAICERAGVKKGSFYHFFESKAALAVAALDAWWETHTRPTLDAAFSVTVPPLERFERYLDAVYRTQLEMRKSKGRVLGCPFFSVGMESGGLEPEVWEASQRIVARKRKYIEAAIRDAKEEGLVDVDDVEEAAQSVQTLMEGALARARVQNSPEPMHGLYAPVLRLLGARKERVRA